MTYVIILIYIKITHYCAMSVTCLFQYTGIRIFNDHTCEQRIICSTRSVYIFLEKKTPFSPNIIFYYITAPRLNKKYVSPGHQNLAGEFCVVCGEFSDLRCLMNTLQNIQIIHNVHPYPLLIVTMAQEPNILHVNDILVESI